MTSSMWKEMAREDEDSLQVQAEALNMTAQQAKNIFQRVRYNIPAADVLSGTAKLLREFNFHKILKEERLAAAQVIKKLIVLQARMILCS